MRGNNGNKKIYTIVLCSFIALQPGEVTAFNLFETVGNIVKKVKGLPVRVVGHMIKGRPGDAVSEVTNSIEKVARGAAGIIKDPAKLISYASLGTQCAPKIGRLSAGDQTAAASLVDDFARNGPCAKFVHECNSDFGDLFCPDVSGVREDLRALCKPVGSVTSVIGKLSGNQQSEVVKFCNSMRGSGASKTDDALGQGVAAHTLQVLANAGGGNVTGAVQSVMQATLLLDKSKELNKEQLKIIGEMAKNQNNIINKLLRVNEKIAVEGMKQLGESNKRFSEFAKYALSELTESNNDRIKVEREAKIKAEELARLYKRDKEKALAELQSYLLATALELNASHACLGKITNQNTDNSFCLRFPQSSACRDVKVDLRSDLKC